MIKEHPEVIQWEDTGSLIIPDPKRLEKTLLEYFRHGRYASFQRQLNNFGYRRVGSPGKATVYRREGHDEVLTCPESLLTLKHVLRRSVAKPMPRPLAPRFPMYHPLYSNTTFERNVSVASSDDQESTAPFWQDEQKTKRLPASPPHNNNQKVAAPQSPHVAAHALLSLRLMTA